MLKHYTGYIFSRKIDGQTIPQRVQNLVIRNYVKNRELHFLLSVTEFSMNDYYAMLNALLEELDELAGLVFYSTHLLPNDQEHRQNIYETILNHGCSLHFALEELAISTTSDIDLIEDIMLCRRLSEQRQSFSSQE